MSIGEICSISLSISFHCFLEKSWAGERDGDGSEGSSDYYGEDGDGQYLLT